MRPGAVAYTQLVNELVHSCFFVAANELTLPRGPLYELAYVHLARAT